MKYLKLFENYKSIKSNLDDILLDLVDMDIIAGYNCYTSGNEDKVYIMIGDESSISELNKSVTKNIPATILLDTLNTLNSYLEDEGYTFEDSNCYIQPGNITDHLFKRRLFANRYGYKQETTDFNQLIESISDVIETDEMADKDDWWDSKRKNIKLIDMVFTKRNGNWNSSRM